MKEKVLQNARFGLAALLGIIFLYIAMIVLLVVSIQALPGPLASLGMVVSIFVLSFGWILFLGIKEVKPQEAIVLTLFGTYVGTIRREGLYFVNPFCKSLNPAANTKLSLP